MKTELRRQLIHGSGVLFSPLILWFQPWISLVSSVLSIFFLVLGFRKSMSIFHRGFEKSLLRFADSFERGSGFPYFGAFSFYASLTIVSAFFPPHVSALAVLVLSVHDSVATIAGKAFGKRYLPFNKGKTVEGTISGFTASLISCTVFSLFSGYPVLLSVVAAVSGSIIESLPLKFDDNFTVTLGTAAVLLVSQSLYGL
ncbi:MAG: phosphatidate cytidylyltransferase [Candidatus Micrarchaeota archaeon]|nr:phosphatidate cytidylyltransferase [Candidatus Micrarchaeota archaeon]